LGRIEPVKRAAYDVGAMLDGGAWSGYQKLVVALAAFAIILDGFDGQMIGFAIPVLIRDWGVSRGDFAAVVVSGLVGMGIGSFFAGLLGDRLGRRDAVILSCLVFGGASLAIGFSPNLLTMGILRFIAGLGIGGALPTATTLSAEFTPARFRPLAVTATIVCVPLGGALVGLFAGAVMPEFGWRGLFWGGGALSVVLSGVLIAWLPESPRFLARRPARSVELGRLLWRMGHPVPADAIYADASEMALEQKAGLPALFTSARRRDTLSVAATFAFCLFTVYTAFSWLPTLLASEGLGVAVAGTGLTVYNFGGIFGAMICAACITRFGSKWPLAICCMGAAVSALLLRVQTDATAIILLIGLHGVFVNAVQSSMNAVSAHVFPTNIRSTGAGFGLVCGRVGAIVAGSIGAMVIGAGGAGGYFGMLAAAMAATFVTVLLIRNHIPAHRWDVISPLKTKQVGS